MRVRTADASLYERLERAIIALEYALADARTRPASDFEGAFRAQEALQQAGGEVLDLLATLRGEALAAAANSAHIWTETAPAEAALETEPAST